MILYYRTREARRTLRHGFKNAAWEVGDRTLRGILVSERPLKTNDEIKNDEFLEITLDPVQCSWIASNYMRQAARLENGACRRRS